MYNIDEIMDMLDWNNSFEIQKKGRELSKEIRCINVFLQPLHLEHNKNVWDNCAMILAERSDKELHPYLYQLFDWILDMNWPGAFCIWERLKEYRDMEWFNYVLSDCIKEAKMLGEEQWLSNLLKLQREIWLNKNISSSSGTNLGVISPVALTDEQRQSLVEEFKVSWDNHILLGCDNIEWPTP